VKELGRATRRVFRSRRLTEPGWIDGYTEDLRRIIAALVPPESVEREMVRVLSWVIEHMKPCKLPRPTSHRATSFTGHYR
jgi:hypothetical protein